MNPSDSYVRRDHWDAKKAMMIKNEKYKMASAFKVFIVSMFSYMSRGMRFPRRRKGLPDIKKSDQQSLRSACAYAQSDQSLC